MNAMETLKDLQKATLAARARTGDAAISTQVNAGKIRVGRVIYKKSVGDFTPSTGWLTAAEAINELNRL